MRVLKTYSWIDVARCCPELGAAAWASLASIYPDGSVLPFFTSVTVYDDGMVSVKYVGYLTRQKKMADAELEEKIFPFGPVQPHHVAREYVCRKKYEILAAKKKDREGQDALKKVADVFNAAFAR